MEDRLNCTPHLRMDEITRRLFNQEFLADIRFYVGDQIIFAHSFELMKRSAVFQATLQETCGTKTNLYIRDSKYDSFLEFLRFIYTDQCTINEDNGIDLLHLAIKYQVVKLENDVINFLHLTSIKWHLRLFEYCVTNEYEIPKRDIELILVKAVEEYVLVKWKEFESLDCDAVQGLLQLDRVAEGVTEIKLFNALARWLVNYCRKFKIPLGEGRQKFDRLIKTIRFSTMPINDLRSCFAKYPELLDESDCYSIVEHILLHSGGEEWTSEARKVLGSPYMLYNYLEDATFITIFSVSKELIFHGLRIGSGIGSQERHIDIEISERCITSNEVIKFQFEQSPLSCYPTKLISLGAMWRLKPKFEYSIACKYPEFKDVYGRHKDVDLRYNNPENSVKIIKASWNVVEMFFNLPRR